MFREIKETWTELRGKKTYENWVEAFYLLKLVRKLVGVSVYMLKSTHGGKIVAQFSYIGFICFVIWYSAYFYCVIKIFSTDQTILRYLYVTKLQRYGDEAERISTMLFVLYSMWKLPFDTDGNCQYAQQLVEIDQAIERLGQPIDYYKCARTTMFTVSLQIIFTSARVLSIWASLANLKTSLPFEKMFQVVYSDTQVLVTTAQYCTYLYLLKDRYRSLNIILDSIYMPKTQPLLMMVVERRMGREPNIPQLQDKYTSERIRSCGKIYAMLYEASETANRKYGLSITLTMLMCLALIILYLFYFMEATASGFFHEFRKYVDFLIYVSWQIVFAIGIIFLNIYFCDNTVKEAKVTSFVTHKIINSEINPLVRNEAVNLSLQIIHQLPSFTVRGLSKIDYVLLLEGSRTVVTFLVMLIQFAADIH